MEYTFRQADAADAHTVAALAAQMWTDAGEQTLCDEFARQLRDPDCAVFLAFAAGQAVGFAQCGLRHDYVEGTETSPVGYLEGVFVRADCRRRGLARRLLAFCEDWARAKGCSEFASDCELDNTDSLQFHLQNGFQEANRIICFCKRL